MKRSFGTRIGDFMAGQGFYIVLFLCIAAIGISGYNLAATPTVSVGDEVGRGDVIGSVGSTAMAESALASHLHLEMAQNGVSVDPTNYLSEWAFAP